MTALTLTLTLTITLTLALTLTLIGGRLYRIRRRQTRPLDGLDTPAHCVN